ncbi:response regulator transcription factor [Cellulomonas bogoriensis]|uniref:Chemotaxis protein CheY n=1 Tax=Cellulomonas bogoriensis 69B4 = DSM 16987 TaxID=1386082 RepID=A0A0A0C0Q3_9CELL|nr:response regulator transcription factor [Cellulomonas bogoriensis]KGM14218.1 chemotaxis protein CheY [Cellulomonas bogoriensis 69B4 = DSM 16987]
MGFHLLIVEDDDGIALPLSRTFQREGHTVTRAPDGATATQALQDAPVDLVILDLGLPDVDGLDLCRDIRAGGYDGGILILTARGSEIDRVLGLDMGADDYLPKPFAVAELQARVRALLRRATPRAAANDAGEAGTGRPAPPAPSTTGLRVDTSSRRVWAGTVEVPLTPKEFDVLRILHAEDGGVVTRERLMDQVWDENWFGSTKTLDVTIGRLRHKLEERTAPARIVAVRGVGFRLEPVDPGA